MNKKETISVACGLILKNGHVLVARRAEDKQHGGMWEFPGGKFKFGENGEETIIRELKEELDVDVEVVKALEVVHYEYPEFFITLYPFVCSVVSGTPRKMEHADLKWSGRDDLQNFKFSPADWLIVHQLIHGLILEGF